MSILETTVQTRFGAPIVNVRYGRVWSQISSKKDSPCSTSSFFSNEFERGMSADIV